MMDESRRAAQTGASGETENKELAILCEAANRLLDQLGPVMQEAHDEGAKLYNELRDRALAGEEITEKDVAKMEAVIQKWRVLIYEAHVRLFSQDEVFKSDFVGILLEMRIHRMDTLPFGGVTDAERSTCGETQTYVGYLDEYLNDGDVSYLLPVSDFQISQLHIDPKNITKNKDLGHTLHTVSFVTCGRRQDIKVSSNLSENPIKTDSYQNFDWEVFLEIFQNAVDAMPDGGEIKVEGKITEDGNNIVIIISDTGSGMSAEILEKVLKGGFTTKSTGTGRGLGMVKRYIEQIVKGEFKMESQEGKGTTVTMVIPLAKG